MWLGVAEGKTKLIGALLPTNDKNNIGILFRTKGEIQSEEESQNPKNKRIRLIRRNQMNYFQKVDKFIEIDHIHSFLDQLCINQRTLKNRQNDQSILKTIFRVRTINMVEINSDYVCINLRANKMFSHIPYIIDRFNSFGDSFFHSLALKLKAINQTFEDLNLMQKIHAPQSDAQVLCQKSQQLSTLLDSLKDKAFFMKTLPNQFFISKQFLRILGRDWEQFAEQCIQYRVIIDDFFTSDNYPFLLERSFYIMDLFCKAARGEITLQNLTEASKLEYDGCLRGKNERRIDVRLKSYMPNGYCYVMLVEKIKNVKESGCDQKLRRSYLQQKVAYNIRTLKELIPLQTKYLGMPVQKICRYKAMRIKNKKEDADFQI